ncbi:U3 small nucleolar RNA-associated protein [Crepidotus variabilis]|uniref:U3 small nucleolar RNA-associated protein n=1 Tax=Crepidotus variabilis TaxID=179855 RepID=A0A9P6JTW3_9AGAR|nr:U3 small nucleolar RNA-associated protein [Crepidotus variabilis]
MAIPPPSRPKLKTAFKKARTIAPLYTSGGVATSHEGKRIVTCVGEDILLTDVENGTEICRFAGDTQPINSLCVTPSSSHLLVFTSALSLRIYELPTLLDFSKKRIQPIRVVGRAHEAPVHVCKVDPTSTYLASGSADGVVKVWNILGGYVTHVFKGHGGVVSALAFNFPQDASSVSRSDTMYLITASVDTRIRVFNLVDGASTSSGGGKPEAVLEGHVSVPRGLDVSHDGKWLVSGGRDSVVLIWDLLAKSASPEVSTNKSKKGKQNIHSVTPVLVKTIPALERVEAVGIIRPEDEVNGSMLLSSDLRIYTAGEKGIIRIWNGKAGEVIQQLGKEHDNTGSEELEEQRQIMNVLYIASTSTIASIHADQNIMFHSLTNGSLTRQLIGYNDEIVDASFLNYSSNTTHRDSHLALATNSSLIRIYSTQNLDSRLLGGHTEIVLALDHSANGSVLVSGSKDRTARLWAPLKLTPRSSSWGYTCVGVCEGHAESVGAVAMAREGDSPKFMFTGSQDRTIKMWDLLDVPLSVESDEGSPMRCKSLTTQKAHEKDINSLDVSPNDRFLVSGSQDRTAKIFEIQYVIGAGGARRGELKHIGTCKGHKRGVWTVRFGKAERVLATGSGDKTVKLWSLDDFSCLKTFEGHTNSVLRVDFLNAGLQIVSTASDGLVKLWNIQEEECVTTLDNHEDKVWALAVSSDERTVVSGAADSLVTFWEDCTEEVESEKEAKRAELVLKDQDFLNYVALRDYRRAIELALAMSQPGRLLSLFKDVAASLADEEQPSKTITGDTAVDEVIRTLAAPDLVKLLLYVREWNTNGKTSPVAQRILFAVFKLRPADSIIQAFSTAPKQLEEGVDAEASAVTTQQTALNDLLEALIPYSERHLARMDKLVQESFVVDYILGEMDDGMFDNDLEGDEMQVE